MTTQSVKPHNVKWQVSLSNGETFFEDKGDYREIKGESSPWQRLNLYAAKNNLSITSLSLYTDDGRTFNLPSLGKNPKFRQFSNAEKPLDYNLVRCMSREMDFIDSKQNELKISEWFTVAEAIYRDYKLQMWVDEKNTQNSWVLVIKN